jgi:plastocyanin
VKRTILALATLVALAIASTATAAASSNTTLIIRHQTRGCHAWSAGSGLPYKPAQSLKLAVGSAVTVINNDAMAHQIFQTSGPHVTITKVSTGMMDMSHEFKGMGVMGRPGASVKIVFAKPGIYKFKTRFGEDYMKMPDTIGEDNTLTLKVVVR